MDLMVKMNDYETQRIQLDVPYLKLNPLSIMSVYSYSKLFTTLKKSKEWDFIHIDSDYGFEVYYPSRVAWRKLRRQGKLLDVLVYGAGAIKNFTIHPLKGNISPIPSEEYLVDENTVLAVRTGEITKSGIVPTGFKKLIKMSFGMRDVAFTEHLIRIKHKNEDTRLYTILFLNTELGKHISKIAYYGALQPQLDENILKSIPIPIPNDFDKIKDILTKFNNALICEIRAWEAYFKAMKIIEENIDHTIADIDTNIGKGKYSYLRESTRLDSKVFIALSIVEDIAKTLNAELIKLSKLFYILRGSAPSDRKFGKTMGIPYITTKSIDKSGFIDYSEFYYLPKNAKVRNRAKKGAIVLLKDAHSAEALGKIGLVYPYDEIPVVSDLYILNPKKDVDSYYIFALLKSVVFKKILQLLSYGLTAHISIKDLSNLYIPIIDSVKEEVSNFIKNFVENIYKANEMKREAIKMLENELTRALYGDKNDESRG